jgi:hypothetical protein
MVKPARLAPRIAAAIAIFAGLVLLAAFFWTVSHPQDDSRLSIVAGDVVYLVAIPAQVVLATLRVVTLHDFGLPALILGVVCAEFFLLLFVHALTRKNTKDQSTPTI